DSAKDEPGALEFGHISRHSIYGWQTVTSEGGTAIRRSRFVQDVGYLCPDNALRPGRGPLIGTFLYSAHRSRPLANRVRPCVHKHNAVSHTYRRHRRRHHHTALDSLQVPAPCTPSSSLCSHA